MIVATVLVAYVLVGLLTAKVLYIIEDTGPEDLTENAAFYALAVAVWPLVWLIAVVAGLVRMAKAFLLWDVRHTVAKRRTKKIENELDKQNSAAETS